MSEYIWNPKVKGSGIITCIPQRGLCPNNCSDCFFQSGRSYLEPLKDNLPQIPSLELAKGRVVRINDGNDSNNQRLLVMKTADQFNDYFFNTAIPENLEDFIAPIVLTLNPGDMTDKSFHKLNLIPKNLMFVRFRANMWNIGLLYEAVAYYSSQKVPIVITFMAYYTETMPEEDKQYYEWKKRTLNSYWVLKKEAVNSIIDTYKENPYVYSCGVKGQHACNFCGNCIREYYNTKERLKEASC